MQQENSNFIKNFSDGLKFARLRKGVTLEELAEAIGEKTGSVIANWERRGNGPHRSKIAKLQDFFDVEIDPASGVWRQREHAGALREEFARADASWMLAGDAESVLIEKLTRALRDDEVELCERVRRAQMFLDELARRGRQASSAVDAAAKQALALGAATVQRRAVESGHSPKAVPTKEKVSGPAGGVEPGQGGQL